MLFLAFVVLPLALILGAFGLFWLIVSLAAGFIAAGVVCCALGAFGTYLAMVSPVQLQPIPALLFVVGIAVIGVTGFVT